MTSTSGTGRLAISAKTLSKARFDSSVNSSLPSTKYSVNCAGGSGRAASAAPNCACTCSALRVGLLRAAAGQLARGIGLVEQQLLAALR